MSGRDNRGSGNIPPLSSAVGKIKDRLSREDQPYQRVDLSETPVLSTSNTATSLDTILPEDPFLYPSHSRPEPQQQQTQQKFTQKRQQQNFEPELPAHFGPIIDADDINEPPLPIASTKAKQEPLPLPLPPPPSSQHLHRDHHTRSIVSIPNEDLNRSKNSLKSSRVSFEKKRGNDSSDEDSFEDKRYGFQQQKAVSVDHKGILKDLKTILAHDNRRQFQAKKHVSLDLKGTRYLQDLLKDSSSEEEFRKNRREFQGRKHQSLDPRVSFKLEKVLQGSSEDSDEENDDVEHKRLIHRPKDITKPVVIDLKDLESESEDDYVSSRQHFQQQRSISSDSRKSIRFYEMDEMGRKKGENIRTAVPFVRQITEDGKPKLEVYRPTTNPIYIWAQVLAAFSVSLGSLVVGFSSAYTSPALVSMTDRNITSFEVTPQDASWVGGLMPLAGLAGGISGGPFIEYLGRRNTILATAVPFIISWLLIACAVNVGMVLAGRALAGFCVGIASLSLPVYLGETIQPEVRGTLGLLPTAFGNIGILVCFVAGTYMDWSMLAFLGGALPVPFLILMFLIPETPRWYVSRNREERARKALVWLRGKEADVEPELKGLMRSQADSDRQATKNQLMELLKRNNLKPLSISLGLMFFQQFSGINAVIFYTVQIFKDAGSTIDGNICTIIVGVVNFIATFIATVLIDRLGRKILLYISDTAMIITLFVLGGFFYCKSSGMDVSNVGWLPLASFVVYILGFSLGFGPIPWLMMGEILPAKIRGSAASVATAFNWSCTFIVTKTFQDMIESIGGHGAFWLFGVICFIGMFFVILYVPETQGKSLEDIERKMMGRVRRMSSVLAAFSVSLCSSVVGFSCAYTSPALVSMTDRNITSFEVTAQDASWVGGLLPLAGLAGGISGGPFIEYLGRRNTILATAVPFIISWLLIACAVNVGMVLAGRALAGFCVGIASLSLPVYLGETIQPEIRGTLGLLPTAFGNIGILVCFVAGTYMDWSMLAFLGGALPVPFLILMFLIPETPRWYVSRNREERARKALVWLRGKEADVEPELKGLMLSQADSDRQATKNQLMELLKRNNLKPLSISIGLMFFQQFSGINAVIYYTVEIFKDAGSTIDGNICTIIVGVVNFIATFIATVLIDRLGRKILLYISDTAMIITLFVLGGFFYCKSSGMDVSNVGWLPLASFVVYILGFSLGFGPIPWLMMGEILPAKIRGSAASVATAFNWSCTFIVTKTFRDMIESIGGHGAFWLFGVICFIGMFFVILYVPETQGKSLEDIERKMMGRVRRMCHR